MTDPPNSTSPKAIAERGETIYKEEYRQKYEEAHLGKFVVIEISSGQAYLGDTPDAAFESAREESPQGLFHLIKVGSPGAFRASYSPSDSLDWVFQ